MKRVSIKPSIVLNKKQILKAFEATESANKKISCLIRFSFEGFSELAQRFHQKFENSGDKFDNYIKIKVFKAKKN